MIKLDMLHSFTKNPQDSARLELKEITWKSVACCGHGGHGGHGGNGGHGSSSRRFGPCATDPELSPPAFADLSLQHTVHGVDPSDASYN